MASMSKVLETVRAIEGEMQRVGYSSDSPPDKFDASKLYAGATFEQWLQFVFLPAVAAAALSGDFGKVPGFRIGLAALRQYDYHSVVEEAHPLMRLCQDLEHLLDDEKARIE